MMASGQHSCQLLERPWVLPEDYAQLPPLEQVAELRSAIIAYLQAHGSAAKSIIAKEIGVRRPDTFTRALDYLSTTQQVYVDAAAGSRDPIYYSNGRLAHPSSQTSLNCGRYEFVVRAYDDRLAGKTVTVTQYALLPSGDRRALGGIRLDWQDLDGLIEKLSTTLTSLRQNVGEFRAGTQSMDRRR
jgi:hypothetical protein